MEPHFYAALLELLGLADEPLPDQHDHARWPEMKERFAAVIRTRTRDQWCAAADGIEVCVAPVLGVDEVEHEPHLKARSAFVRQDGIVQPAPSPRFSRTPASLSRQPPLPGEHTAEALADWGFAGEQIAALVEQGALGRRTEQPARS